MHLEIPYTRISTGRCSSSCNNSIVWVTNHDDWGIDIATRDAVSTMDSKTVVVVPFEVVCQHNPTCFRNMKYIVFLLSIMHGPG